MARTVRTPDHLRDGDLLDRQNRRRNTPPRRQGTRTAVIAAHLAEVR